MTAAISRRLAQLPASATLAINSRVQALREQGRDVLNFSVGEPDFPTPERIRHAAQVAMDRGLTRYTEERGIKLLREAVATVIARDYGVQFSPEQVCISNGGKQVLYNLFMAILNPGDEVLIPAPYWLTYPPQVQLAEGLPVIVPTRAQDGFQLDPELLERHCTPRTRAIVLNSPSNPSGVALNADSLRAVAALALKHDLLIVTDDLYYKLIYDDFRFISIARLVPEVADRTVIVGGLSKAYAMTGWRIGYGLGPLPVIKAMANLQGQTTSNACTVSQHAALEALTGETAETEIAQMVRVFSARREKMVQRLKAIPDLTCPLPEGAFYTFPSIEAFLGRRTPEGRVIDSSVTLAGWLVDAAEIASVPGSVFGDDKHLRFSYACDLKTIEAGMDRLQNALSRLS